MAALARNRTKDTDPFTPRAELRDKEWPIKCVIRAITLRVNTARTCGASTLGAVHTRNATEALARSAIAIMYVWTELFIIINEDPRPRPYAQSCVPPPENIATKKAAKKLMSASPPIRFVTTLARVQTAKVGSAHSYRTCRLYSARSGNGGFILISL